MKDYDGSGSARRFFVNCEQEFKDLSTHSWIYAVEACFVGKAAEWVSQQSEIQNILDLEEPGEEDKKRFIALVRQKYPDRKPPTHKQWMIQLKELKQNEEESLGQYYVRTHEILRGLGGQDNEKDDEAFSRIELTVLGQIIEKFVDGISDRQLRVKLSYKYMIEVPFEAQSLYDVYLAAEEYSERIASKKKALRDLYEDELLDILRTQGAEAAIRFATIDNQPEPYTRKPKSIPVDRIKRYRSASQHTKPESTLQNNTIKENKKHDHRRQASKANDAIDVNHENEKVARKELSQPCTDANSSDSNDSALSRIPGGSQTTTHPDSSISENLMALPSQSEPICDPVSNERTIRSEKPTEKEESTEDYASGPCKWPAPTTLPECTVVNKSPQVSLQKSYQMQENRSVPSHSASSSPSVSPTRVSKPWLTQNWRARPQKPPIDESPPVPEQIRPEKSETYAAVDITNTLGKPVASESDDWPVPTSLQKSSPKVSIFDESPPVLEQIPPEMLETNAKIVDISDTESKKDDILAFGPSNWTAASAEKKVFTLADTYKAFLKNPPTLYLRDIETSAAVDMPSLEHLTNEDSSATGAFGSVTNIAAYSKNPSIQHTENLETLEKDSVYIELPALPAFDLSIDIDFEAYTTDSVTSEVMYSSNQPPVTPRTWPVSLQATEKTSDYGREQSLTCSAEYATTSYEREQSSTCSADYATSDYGREQVTCSANSSITLQDVECYTTSSYEREQSSTCSADYATSSYEREQSSTCSADYMPSCYEEEQDTCLIDTTSDVATKPYDTTVTKPIAKSTITKPVHHALLAYCLAWIQHTILPFYIMLWTLYEYITLFDLSIEYKARPKVKIKRLLEPKHIESRSRIVGGIFIESAYKIALFSGTPTMIRILEIIAEYSHKMATFSDTAIRVSTPGISGCFAYNMAPFSGSLQGLETFNFEVNESAYDFGFRACKTATWFYAIATRVKPYFYDISAISDICFTNPIASRTQRGLIGLIFGVKIAMHMGIYATCLEMI